MFYETKDPHGLRHNPFKALVAQAQTALAKAA